MVASQQTGIPNALKAVTPQAHTSTETAEYLRKLIEHKIAELQARTDIKPESEKQRLIDALQGVLSSGNLSAVSVQEALNRVASQATQEAAESVVESITSYELMRDYGLNEGDVRRVRSMSKRVDLKDRKSVEAFADAMIDPTMPEAQRKQLVQDTANHVTKHPEIIKDWNAASPEARTEASAAYVKTQRTLKELAKDGHYGPSKEVLELLDHLGLEADPKVQESVRLLQNRQLTQEEFAAKVAPQIVTQKAKIIAELSRARETVLAHHPEKTEHLKGMETHEIAATAVGVFRQRKQNPNYTMTPKEEASMEVFLLSKQTMVLKMLGNNALSIDKGLSFERDAGTLEQRTERAMAMLRENMPPELTGIPQKRLEELVKKSLAEADKRNVSVANLDTLSGETLYNFSSSVAEEMMQKKKEDFRNAERAEQKAMEVAEKAVAEAGINMKKMGIGGGEASSQAEEKAATTITAKAPEEPAVGSRLG